MVRHSEYKLSSAFYFRAYYTNATGLCTAHKFVHLCMWSSSLLGWFRTMTTQINRRDVLLHPLPAIYVSLCASVSCFTVSIFTEYEHHTWSSALAAKLSFTILLYALRIVLLKARTNIYVYSVKGQRRRCILNPLAMHWKCISSWRMQYRGAVLWYADICIFISIRSNMQSI